MKKEDAKIGMEVRIRDEVLPDMYHGGDRKGVYYVETMDKFAGKTSKISRIEDDRAHLENKYNYPWSWIEPVVPIQQKTPRKHAELIKKWADDQSLVIQCRSNGQSWMITVFPDWSADEYRIKPETQKVELYQYAYFNEKGSDPMLSDYIPEEKATKEYFGTDKFQKLEFTKTIQEIEV